jgi:hypothetical protein
VPAQRLEHRVDEQVLHLHVRQVPADELLVVLPQPVGDLTHRGLGDQQLPGGVGERVLHVPGRQAAGVHLVDQGLEHLTVAVQKPHQARPERLARATHLRDRHVDEALRGAQPAPLVPVARPDLVALPAAVAATATQEVGLLALEQLLHHQPGHRLHQRRDDVRLTIHTTGEQLLQLRASHHRRGYPSHRPAPHVGPHHPT